MTSWSPRGQSGGWGVNRNRQVDTNIHRYLIAGIHHYLLTQFWFSGNMCDQTDDCFCAYSGMYSLIRGDTGYCEYYIPF